MIYNRRLREHGNIPEYRHVGGPRNRFFFFLHLFTRLFLNNTKKKKKNRYTPLNV